MLSVLVNGSKVNCTALSFSSVDPGGFETCSFTPRETYPLNPGDDVRVFEGVETAWHGRIDEPGVEISLGRISHQVNAVGYGADLRSQPNAIVFVDSDPSSSWTGSTLERKIAIKPSGYQSYDGSVDISTSGVPGPHLSFAGAWGAIRPLSELCNFSLSAPYRRFYATWTLGSLINRMDGNWQAFVVFLDTAGTVLSSISLLGSQSGSFGWEAPLSTLIIFQLYYDAGTAAGTEGSTYEAWLTNVSLYGDHNLTVRSQLASSGTTVHGLYLSDIVDEIIKRSGTRFDRKIEANDSLVTQATYPSPAAADDMLEDMRKLSGWHWGVWEPGSFSDRPTFIFSSPPKSANVSVDTADCNALDITESLSALYNEIYFTYTSGLGKPSYVTYANPHPRIKAGETRRLVMEGGNYTDEAAAVFARYVLLLTQADSRVTGSCELPTKTREGKWAHLIRPGREKMRFINLPISSRSLVGDNSSRVDTFRISRISVSVDQTGIPKTSVEFDRGADLIEVLQARVAQGNTRIGF